VHTFTLLHTILALESLEKNKQQVRVRPLQLNSWFLRLMCSTGIMFELVTHRIFHEHVDTKWSHLLRCGSCN